MSTLRETPAPPLETWPPQACRNADPRWFFPAGEYGSTKVAYERQAKAFCGQCLAKEECLAYAMPIVDLTGIWGSMNENERTRARKKQRKERIE